jgi:hypothetical protein
LDASIIGFYRAALNPIWVFFNVGEKPSGWAILGGIIILGAVILSHFTRAEKSAAEHRIKCRLFIFIIFSVIGGNLLKLSRAKIMKVTLITGASGASAKHLRRRLARRKTQSRFGGAL